MAGAIPNATTVRAVRQSENSNMRTSSGGTCSTGRAFGTSRESSGNAAKASPTAAAPPINPRIMLSESSCRTM